MNELKIVHQTPTCRFVVRRSYAKNGAKQNKEEKTHSHTSVVLARFMLFVGSTEINLSIFHLRMLNHCRSLAERSERMPAMHYAALQTTFRLEISKMNRNFCNPNDIVRTTSAFLIFASSIHYFILKYDQITVETVSLMKM